MPICKVCLNPNCRSVPCIMECVNCTFTSRKHTQYSCPGKEVENKNEGQVQPPAKEKPLPHPFAFDEDHE